MFDISFCTMYTILFPLLTVCKNTTSARNDKILIVRLVKIQAAHSFPIVIIWDFNFRGGKIKV